MPQVIHIKFEDDDIAHVELSRDNWNRWIADPAVASMWTHPVNDCCCPIMRENVGWKTSAPVSPIEQGVVWPPAAYLHFQHFQELAGVGALDALILLVKKEERKEDPPPKLDGKQFTLF